MTALLPGAGKAGADAEALLGKLGRGMCASVRMGPPTDQTKPEYTLKGRHGYYSRVISA